MKTHDQFLASVDTETEAVADVCSDASSVNAWDAGAIPEPDDAVKVEGCSSVVSQQRRRAAGCTETTSCPLQLSRLHLPPPAAAPTFFSAQMKTLNFLFSLGHLCTDKSLSNARVTTVYFYAKRKKYKK